MSTRAKRGDWKTQAFPEQRARLPLERVFNMHEVARIERGIVPRGMEEKWFVFAENDWVYFFRSWTGSAVYEVKLENAPNGGKWVTEAWIAAPNGPPADPRDEARRLSYLFDALFFGRH